MKALQDAPNEPVGINLNIGCGKKIWPGFINIDFPGNWSKKKPDIECDVRHLTLPDNYADTAYAIHVLEHIHRWETESTLREWARVLKPGGKLVIEVPCLDRVLESFITARSNQQPIDAQLTMWRLYGDPRYEEPDMVHKWCFLANELRTLLESIGLERVVITNPEYHHPLADMRAIAYKCK